MTVTTGMSTPVSRKPVMAGVKFSPDSTPSIGGKMRFPAPKNMENSMRPTATTVPVMLGRLAVEDEDVDISKFLFRYG